MSAGRTWFGALGALLTIATTPSLGAESIYTSLKEEECHVPSSAIAAAYDAEGTTI